MLAEAMVLLLDTENGFKESIGNHLLVGGRNDRQSVVVIGRIDMDCACGFFRSLQNSEPDDGRNPN